MNLLILLSIPVFCVFIIVQCGLIEKLKYWLAAFNIWGSWNGTVTGVITRRLRPFDCEKCAAWWIALIYLLTFEPVFESIILAGATAFLTSPLKKLL